MSADEIVQTQLDAFNQRDAQAFAACYSEVARVIGPDGSVMAEGRSAIQELYGQLFGQSENLEADVVNRIVSGSWVVDDESITGMVFEGMPSNMRAAVCYRIDGDLITQAQMLM